MAQNLNQLTLKPVAGMVDLSVGVRSVITCILHSSSAGGILPGQAVKAVDVSSGILQVVETDDENEEKMVGFITYDLKDKVLNPGDKVEVTLGKGSVIYLTASGAIPTFSHVMLSGTGNTVALRTSGSGILGLNLDKANAEGDLVRVLMDLPIYWI